MADYTVPFAPTSYQPVARYTNPYVGSLLELMQQQSRAQADADTRRMQLAGQLWQNLAQAGSQTVQAMAEAPERRRQQQLAQMQFDQAVRQRDIQTAVDNIPTDTSQWTTYLGNLKPFQANAVQAAMLQLQEAAKQRQNATADARGMAAAAELSSNAPSLNRFNAGEVRAGRMTPADAQAQTTALSTLSALPAGEAFAKGGIAPARGFDQDAFTRSRLGGVVMQSPTIQAEMVKSQLAAFGKRVEPQKVSQGETINMPAVTAFGEPAATIEGGTKTPTAEETMLAAYRASLGLAPGATMTSEQWAKYPKWKAEQGQSSAPPSDLARAIARYAASKGKRPEDVTYAEELLVREQLDKASRDPRAPVLPVIIQGPDGPLAVTRPTDGAPPTAAPVLGPGNQPVPRTPTGAERLSAANDAATLALLTDIETSMSDEWVGPVAGRWANATKNLPGMAPSPAQATFYANVATLRNQMINLLSGAAVSASEERRMMDQLPDPAQNPSVFRANLAATKKNRERLLDLKQGAAPASTPPPAGARQ